MTHQQREAIDTALRGSPLDLGADPLEQRAVFAHMVAAAPVPEDVITTSGDLGGVPVITVEIAGLATEGTILYFHGGAFAIGSASASVGLAADLARTAHMRVVTVDYRLAPEHSYPAAHLDAVTAYRAFVDGRPGGSAVAGESAGANLAITAVIEALRTGLPQPSSVLLMSPWVDLAMTGQSATTKADLDPALTVTALRVRAADYLRGADATDGSVSPIHADLTGLPPLLIQAGSHEVLLDDATRLATRAAADDVDVTLDIVPAVPHVFQAFAAHLDEGAAALQRAGAFLWHHAAS